MSLIERVATALYDHCHEAEHGEVYENETEAGREYWNSFAIAAIAAMPQLEAMQAEIDRLNERLVETQMLAFKWMEAHDKLQAGKPYEFPKPADVPDAIAEIDRLRDALGAAWPVVAEMTGTEWAGVGKFKSWQEADNSLRAIKAKVRASLGQGEA